ncbi:uncharacterized protein B0T15DRAFT_511065 [Chaetomium strumarium]|uniref:Secreted protein n=1 Tax=Chaetomium strumarium TaxID=1170767 RepID=A0AAJ0GS47_9PEZI|nr:hypothetical protein B0T15DRAFT_511065 [Chaetomium strumarium]
MWRGTLLLQLWIRSAGRSLLLRRIGTARELRASSNEVEILEGLELIRDLLVLIVALQPLQQINPARGVAEDGRSRGGGREAYSQILVLVGLAADGIVVGFTRR